MTARFLDRAERFKLGKGLRARTPRELHADLHGPLERDAVALLAESDKHRLPELLPERYRRMTDSAFAFLRGAAAVMTNDLARQPIAGASVQACGDCHLFNFGAFYTPENNILFDINDFDETLPGVDFTVDVKRLATSIAVAGAALGLSKSRRHELAAAAVRSYRKHMVGLSVRTPLEIWHSQINLEIEIKKFRDASMRKKMQTIIARARGDGLDRDDNFPTLAQSGAPLIHDKAPRIFHFAPGSDAAKGFSPEKDFAKYRAGLAPAVGVLYDRFALKDFVFK